MRARRLVAGLVAVCACAVLAAPARAAGEPGWWYYTDYTVDKAHAKGITGEGVTIALLDGPIDPSVPWLKDADIESLSNPVCAGANGEDELAGTSTDPRNVMHTTLMAGMYAGNGKTADGGRGPLGVAPGAHIITIPTATAVQNAITDKADCIQPKDWATTKLDPALGFQPSDVESVLDQGSYAIAAAINMAIDKGADIIHTPFVIIGGITAGGYINEGDPLEAALLRAMREGVIVVTGHANNKQRLTNTSSAPADLTYFPGTLTVNSVDETWHLADGSNINDPGVDILAPGVGIWTHEKGNPATYASVFEVGDGGTSSASAIMTGYLALLMNKYPEATGNQILRLALASTLLGEGTMTRDPKNFAGWGVFSFAYMDTDPTTLPDTNPIYLYDIEDALDAQAKYRAGEYKSPSDWLARGRDSKNHDVREWWPKEFALYDEMTAKANPTATATGSTTATAGVTDDSSSAIPLWVWIAAGAVILTAAALALILTARKRRARPPASGPPLDPQAPHFGQVPPGAGGLPPSTPPTPPGAGSPPSGVGPPPVGTQGLPPSGPPPHQPPTNGNGL